MTPAEMDQVDAALRTLVFTHPEAALVGLLLALALVALGLVWLGFRMEPRP